MEKVMLYKFGKWQEAFEYVYKNVKILGYIVDSKSIETYNDKKCINIQKLDENFKTKIIICDNKNKYIANKFAKYGLKENLHFFFIEDYVKQLDVRISKKTLKNIFDLLRNYKIDLGNGRAEIRNSEMFIKMMNMEPKHNLDCHEPFRFAQIQHNGLVYPCCESWATESIGNAYHESLNKIWNSTRARIYRWSIINKTYAFCNLNNCPLKDQGGSKEIENKNLEAEKYPECLSLSIDLTCKYKCKSCRKCVINNNDNLGYQKVYNKIYSRLFKDKWIPKVYTLLLPQDGEVFYSNIYKKILFNKKTRKTHSLVIHTNGLELNKEMLEKLHKVNSKNLALFISLDSLNEQTYKELRDGGDLETLLKNLKLISKARNKGELEYVRILFILQRANYKELPEIAKLAIDLKFDYLDVTRITNWGSFTDKEFESISMYDKNGEPLPELQKVLKDPIFKSQEIEYIGNVLKNNK